MPCFQRSMGPAKWRNPGWVLPFWIIGGIEILVCLSCFCFSIYVYRNHGVSTSRPDGFIAPSLKYMNLCGVISFLCCSITQCINVWYWNVYYDTHSLIQTVTWSGTWFFWSTGIFMTYLLFLHRIRITFTGSSLEPSRCTIISLYILLSLYFVLYLSSSILLILLFFDKNIRIRLGGLEFILPISFVVLELVLSISMTWTFVSRLYSLILMESVHYYDESMKAMAGASDAAVIHSQHSLRRRTYKMSFTDDSQMMHISVKIAILITVSLTSSAVLMGLRAADCFLSSETLIGKAMAMYCAKE